MKSTSPITVARLAGYDENICTERAKEESIFAYRNPTNGMAIMVVTTKHDWGYSYEWSHHDKDGEVLKMGTESYQLEKYLREFADQEPFVEKEPENLGVCKECHKERELDSNGICFEC